MENFENQNQEQDFYKTGSTKPPKNRGGLVAGLLIAVILLAGVSSILGVMNIQLFRMLEAEKDESVSFVPSATAAGPVQEAAEPRLGLTVDNISELNQRFYDLPAGVLIIQVDARGCGARAGLAVGDIIVSFNGEEVLTVQALEQALQECRTGDRVEVEIYRSHGKKQFKTTVTLENNG